MPLPSQHSLATHLFNLRRFLRAGIELIGTEASDNNNEASP